MTPIVVILVFTTLAAFMAALDVFSYLVIHLVWIDQDLNSWGPLAGYAAGVLNFVTPAVGAGILFTCWMNDHIAPWVLVLANWGFLFISLLAVGGTWTIVHIMENRNDIKDLKDRLEMSRKESM